MTSPLLALFTRSLREDTRSKSTYWARAGLAAFVLVVMWMSSLAGARGGAPGLEFLKNAMWLQTVFLTIAGLAYFASAITEEKEEETLGLLRMTNLSPLAILLGKSTSRLGGALLLIGAQLPFTLLAVTLGGVAPGQVFAAYATLGAYAFLLGNLALFASVIAPRTAIAAVLTGAVLWGLGGAVENIPGYGGLSPFNRLDEIFTTGFHDAPVGRQVIGSVLLGLMFFVLAWIFFERLCGGRQGSSLNLETLWRRRFHGWFAPGRPRAFRALAWKDFHFLHGGRFVIVAKTAVCVILLAVAGMDVIREVADLAGPEVPLTMFGCGLLWLIAEAAFAASRICACEVRDRTLSSLVLLPQSLPVTMSAKISAFWPAAIPALGLIGLSLVSALFVGIASANAAGVLEGIWAVTVVGSIAFLYVFAMSYFGVHLTAYLSLRMKRGALPLAVIICLASGIFASIPLLGWIGVPAAALIVGHSLRAKIFQRLEDLAAEN